MRDLDGAVMLESGIRNGLAGGGQLPAARGSAMSAVGRIGKGSSKSRAQNERGAAIARQAAAKKEIEAYVELKLKAYVDGLAQPHPLLRRGRP